LYVRLKNNNELFFSFLLSASLPPSSPFSLSLHTLLELVPETIDAYINASKTVLKQGEPLTVNCTVHGVELVFFSWDYPNRDVSGREEKRGEENKGLLFDFPFTRPGET
jgi:hypothetical protein